MKISQTSLIELNDLNHNDAIFSVTLNPFKNMNSITTCFYVLLITSSTLGSFIANAQQNSLIAEGAEVTLVASDYSFTEGPAVDSQGNVFFTDQPNNRIMKWSIDGSLSVFMEGAGRANGLYFDNESNLLVCADLNNELWSIDANKNVSVLIDDFEGKELNGPNDLWVDPKGGIYFTDPYYQRNYWERTEKEIENERVYYLTPDKQKTLIVADDLVQPNGIIGTSDGRTLYIADIRDKKTYSYDMNDDGTLSNKTLFMEMGSDGMTIDNKGNIYITGRGVIVFNKKGEKILNIPIEQRWTANVTFGGPKQQTLFITASTTVYTLEMKVHGVR